MVDNKGIWGRIKESFWDIGITLGLNVLFKEMAKKTAEKGASHLHEKIFTDKRAELLNDFRLMPEEEKHNLIRRHHEAILKFTENRFVTLLCKIEPDPNEGRQPMLKWLNGLSDAEFDQMLSMLEHDVLLQWFQRARVNIARLTKADFEKLKVAFCDGAEQIDEIAEKLTPKIKEFRQWLEEIGGIKS